LPYPPLFQPDVGLVETRDGTEVVGESFGLIVAARSRDVAIDFLQTDQVGVLVFNDRQHALQHITPVATADSFVNVVAQHTHVVPRLPLSLLRTAPRISSRDDR
jgi:hypothetical protein